MARNKMSNIPRSDNSKSVNFSDLADRLRELNSYQLMLIREELATFRPSFDESFDIDDVIDEMFTWYPRNLRLHLRFEAIQEIEHAIEHVKTLPTITIGEDEFPTEGVKIWSFIRLFFAELIKTKATSGDIHVEQCKPKANVDDVYEVVFHDQNNTFTFLVGKDEGLDSWLMKRCQDETDHLLGSLNPSDIWAKVSNKNVSSAKFLQIVAKCDSSAQRADIYRLVLSEDDYIHLAHAIQPFNELRHFCDKEYFYLQINA